MSIVEIYAAHADPVRAAGMEAYMRGRFRFFGIPTPERRRLSRQALRQPFGSLGELEATLRDLWDRDERELQYFAVELAERNARLWEPRFLETLRWMILTKSWWDTVDVLASHHLGGLLRRYPELMPERDAWVESGELWLQRAALLHQLGYKESTDAERLFRDCERLAGERDFFLRKAVGWALRQYSYVDPEAVRRFVDSHPLSPLSRSEALKAIRRRAGARRSLPLEGEVEGPEK